MRWQDPDEPEFYFDEELFAERIVEFGENGFILVESKQAFAIFDKSGGGYTVKKNFILLLVLLVVGGIGCKQAAYSVQLKQPVNQIRSITFVDNSDTAAPAVVLETESGSQIKDVVADINNLEVGRYLNDPPTSFGYLYIEVRYQNGDVEIIGTDSFLYRSTDGKISESYGGWYYVDLDSMRTLFQKYKT